MHGTRLTRAAALLAVAITAGSGCGTSPSTGRVAAGGSSAFEDPNPRHDDADPTAPDACAEPTTHDAQCNDNS